MALQEKISADLTEALRKKQALRASALRMLKTALKYRQKEIGRDLDDAETISVISSLVRKGKEAAEEYRKGGREELARKEEQELENLTSYLPRQLSPEDVERILREIMEETGAQGPKDMGRLMKAAMARMAGQAQGKEVSEIARRLLAPSPETQ